MHNDEGHEGINCASFLFGSSMFFFRASLAFFLRTLSPQAEFTCWDFKQSFNQMSCMTMHDTQCLLLSNPRH